MTLRVVVDNGNTVPFPALEAADVAQDARDFALAVESGKIGQIQSALLVLETDNGVETIIWGDNLTVAEAIGVIELAKARFINEAFRDDEED